MLRILNAVRNHESSQLADCRGCDHAQGLYLGPRRYYYPECKQREVGLFIRIASNTSVGNEKIADNVWNILSPSTMNDAWRGDNWTFDTKCEEIREIFEAAMCGRIDHVDINEQIYIRDIPNSEIRLHEVYIRSIRWLRACTPSLRVDARFTIRVYSTRFPVITSPNCRVSCNVNRGKHFYQMSHVG